MHDQETQATIERERITSATVKQLKVEIKEEKAKHEQQVGHSSLGTHANTVSPIPHLLSLHCRIPTQIPSHAQTSCSSAGTRL